MNFKTGDKVVVITGKDKGKEGNITKVLRETNKPTRIGHSIDKDGKKIRVTKKSNSSLN